MQKQLRFILPAFRSKKPVVFCLKTAFALLFCSWCLLNSCKLNPDLQKNGEVYLQGQWQQDSVPMEKQLVSYSLYHIKFSCDSFYMKINTLSKVNNGPDSCMNSGRWSEYIKGAYQQRNDTLHLKGQYCNADYSLKSEGGCFNAGVYEKLFTVKKKSDSLLQFSGTDNVIPINARLIERIVCNPKPL